MKRKVIILVILGMLVLSSCSAIAMGLQVKKETSANDKVETESLLDGGTWIRTFGGTSDDTGASVQQTSDGGYVILGRTYSYADGHLVWLVKTDSDGNEIWNKTFGPTNGNSGASVQQTSDGGYIFVGFTWSYGAGDSDAWLVKTDSDGEKSWYKTFGGKIIDYGTSVQQTSDDGFIITGYTNSYGAGGYDFWLIKTNSEGKETWSETYGGTADDYGYSVQQTSDGGYIAAGQTNSYGGVLDVLLIKTNSEGKETWSETYDGSKFGRVYSVQQTSDGGYILSGQTEYYSGDTDVWLIKTDEDGTKIWDKTFDGAGGRLKQTSDGGYILTGSTSSFGAGKKDVLLIKTDASGNKIWVKAYGGLKDEGGSSVQQTSDGGYIITGSTSSFGAGKKDVLLIKTDENGGINNPPETPKISGSSSGMTGVPYTYHFSTTDPEGDKVYYYIDWGDGNNSGWLGPYASGDEQSLSYKWSSDGTYTIKIKAKHTVDDQVSDWNTLEVSMPRSKPLTSSSLSRLFPGFPLLQKLLNLGYWR